MFSRYPFAIDNISWPTSHPHLPDIAEVDLPSYLVEADEINDDEWEDYISKALAAKFGVRPVDIGGFEPAG
jgi:hypothetical protein